MSLRLLYEASLGSRSSWAAYIRVLPRRGEIDLPITWADDDDSLLRLLEPSPIYDDIKEAQDGALAKLKKLRESLQQSSSLSPLLQSAQHWLWAISVMMSRPFVMDQDQESSLKLIPLVDMANHGDHVGYAIQKGDGVFTPRHDIQVVADRPYPANVQFYVTYGPLNSISKFYSFGYLETLTRASSTIPQREEEEELVVPAQGTATFLVNLDVHNEEDDADRIIKEKVLAYARSLPSFLTPALSLGDEKARQLRIEVGTRTAICGGPGLARVTVEDHEAMDRLKRCLRLKHMDGAAVLWSDSGQYWSCLTTQNHMVSGMSYTYNIQA